MEQTAAVVVGSSLLLVIKMNTRMCEPNNTMQASNGFSHHASPQRSLWFSKTTSLIMIFVAILIGSFVKHPHCCRVTRALYKLAVLPENDWNDYYKSLEVMRKPILTSKNDELLVGAWYKIINVFCDLGDLEKMYFPPVVDPTLGLIENQVLIEHKMAFGAASETWNTTYINHVDGKLSDVYKQRYVVSDNGKKQILPVRASVPDDTYQVRPMESLDLGCGKGRIANTVMDYTGGSVVGLNIDATQLSNAMRFALDGDLWPHRLDFRHGSFNDPLPFQDESFDYVYEVGAFTYMMDKHAVFSEIYRVLRPGGSFCYQDWTQLAGYDETNATQVNAILKIKVIAGLIELHDPEELAQIAQKVGFEVVFNDDGGYNAIPSSQLLSFGTFGFMDTIMNNLIYWRVLPERFRKAWKTIRAGGLNELKESIDNRSLNMGHVLLIRKPL